MAQCTYTTKDVLSMLDEDSEDDFEGYIDEEEYADRYENSDAETESSGNSDNEEEMEEDISEIASADEMEVNNETLDDSIDSSSTTSSSTTVGPSFTATPGPIRDMSYKNPIDFFRLMIPDSILEEIVRQTNLYAEQFFENNNVRPRSRAQMWDSLQHNLPELKKFLSLILIMESIHYPTIEDYWSTSWPFASSTFSSIMKRDRFSLLLKFLHLNDNNHFIPKGQPGHDPLHKIHPFLNKILENFQSSFQLGREVSLDESMIGFKGRLGFVQYMPKKPTKWGLKAFVVSDSVTGYAFNWVLYTGKLLFSNTR